MCSSWSFKSMKALFILYLVSHLTSADVYGSDISKHLKDEGHAIAKRFADPDYEFHGHDVAYVLHERQPDTFHRIKRRDLSSVTNGNDDVKRLRLDLNSGESLHLSLKKRSVVDATTEIYHNTKDGLVKREAMATDCYATGHVGDDSGNIASIAMCDGLHGTLIGNGMEYYIHPLNEDEGDHQVHVLWRRQADNGSESDDDVVVAFEDLKENYAKGAKRRSANNVNPCPTTDKVEIEMAMFTDAHFWARLQEIVPGREDEYNIIAMNAVQALYGDPRKVGYEFRITVKLMVNWLEDPRDYNFQEDLGTNMKQFCRLLRDQIKYDMLFLHTGVTQQKGPAAGLAYMTGVCKSHRCACARSSSLNRVGLLSHEIGHNLGFKHHAAADCPDNLKSQGGGFMGGGSGLNFSACNKWELHKLFESGKGMCLLEETEKTEVPKSFVNLPNVLPGQFSSPDYLCQIYAGPGYEYYMPHELSGIKTCQLFLCLDRDQDSPSYRNIIRVKLPLGFPCGDEMFCLSPSKCEPWDQSKMGWDVRYLRENKKPTKWSALSRDWSECTSTCGTGVQIKERRCIVPKGPFLTPYCIGPSIIPRLCATKPCPGDPDTIQETRQVRGDQVCSQFLNNNVPLVLEKGSTAYLPKFKDFKSIKFSALFPSKSCIVSCERVPDKKESDVDGLMIDGTPCLETKRSEYNLIRFNIDMRCTRGECMEFSDCKDNVPKDACGFCGGNPKRCKSGFFTDQVADGERVILGTIPAGSFGIDVQVVELGGKLELWSLSNNEQIFGKGGKYPKNKYMGENLVDFAGTTWSFHTNQFLRAEGKTNEDVIVVLLGTKSPVRRVEVNYIK